MSSGLGFSHFLPLKSWSISFFQSACKGAAQERTRQTAWLRDS